MGDFRKKYLVYRLISREKILSWRLMLEKNLTPLYVRKKNSFKIGLGRNLFTPTKSHIPPPSKVKWSVPYNLKVFTRLGGA